MKIRLDGIRRTTVLPPHVLPHPLPLSAPATLQAQQCGPTWGGATPVHIVPRGEGALGIASEAVQRKAGSQQRGQECDGGDI